MNKLEIVRALLAEESSESASKPVPFKVGSCYLLRTVTYHLTGRVQEIIGDFLVLVDAAWIADSGRFADTISKGTCNEVEPVGTVFVNVTTVTDAFPWTAALPRVQK